MVVSLADKKASEENVVMLQNLELHKDERYVVVSVNPKIYPLDVVYSAAYALIDKAYVLIDGDPAEEIFVELRPKEDKIGPEQLGRELNTELLNYAVYKSQSQLNRGVRETLLQRTFLTNKQDPANCEQDYLKDPEGIAKPWTPKKQE